VVATLERPETPTIVTDPKYATALVPPDEAFPGKAKYLAGGTKGYEDLKKLCDDVIAKHPTRFGGLAKFQFDIFWQRKGSKSGGKGVCGKCSKLSGKQTAYTDGHYRIDIAADLLRSYEFTRYQLEALMFHELSHCDADDESRHKVRGHDVEMFLGEIEEYGLWQMDLKSAAVAFEQARLI
jgi:hypothetical protein